MAHLADANRVFFNAVLNILQRWLDARARMRHARAGDEQQLPALLVVRQDAAALTVPPGGAELARALIHLCDDVIAAVRGAALPDGRESMTIVEMELVRFAKRTGLEPPEAP